MDKLLTFFVALTALAVMTQACVLIAIYLMSRRLTNQLDRFMSETREVMVPVKAITENLRIASSNILEIGVSAREQFRRVETMVSDTGEVLRAQLNRMEAVTKDVADRINTTADIVQNTVLRPVREVSAITKGFGRGLEYFFKKNKRSKNSTNPDDDPYM
jgi:hypothetical protein